MGYLFLGIAIVGEVIDAREVVGRRGERDAGLGRNRAVGDRCWTFAFKKPQRGIHQLLPPSLTLCRRRHD
jgi:hypothetical protein